MTWHQRQKKCINSGPPAASLQETKSSLAEVFEDEAVERGFKDGEYRGGAGSKKETVGS